MSKTAHLVERLVEIIRSDYKRGGASKSDIRELFDAFGWDPGPNWNSTYANLRNKLANHPDMRVKGNAKKNSRWIHVEFHEEDEVESLIHKTILDATENSGLAQLEHGYEFPDYFNWLEEGHRVKLAGLMFSKGIGSPSFRVSCPKRHISDMRSFLSMSEFDKASTFGSAIKTIEEDERIRTMVAGWIAESRTPSQLFVALFSILNIIPPRQRITDEFES